MQTIAARLIAILIAAVAPVAAETGADAWLRYAPLGAPEAEGWRNSLPAVIVARGDSPVIEAARSEITRGLKGMLGRTLRMETGVPKEPAIILGTDAGPPVEGDGYALRRVTSGGLRHIFISGRSDRGVLYGAFALLRKVALGAPEASLDETQSPSAPIRYVNQWDNLDGSIERGYGGRSIFWENGRARADLSRVSQYGRLLASLGIDGCAISNVNANPRLLTPELIGDAARIAAAFRPWGVRVVLSLDFGSPRNIGGLDTFDPLDERVAAWWKNKTDELYAAIPDLGGFVVKADSEGRVGPSAYGRTHADAANVVARALAPHGGVVFYRGFVYDHHMDWRNLKNDRARAADDNFRALDGKFENNAIVQIKHGPIDFQVREPASPLFGTLEKTSQAIELQVTQEYFGQGRHTVFLVPMWKAALDFDMHARGAGTPVKALVTGKVFGRPTGGFVGVVNAGLDDNWFGNHLSQANLYGFGRLAWNPDLTAEQISNEWTRLTFGSDSTVVRTVDRMQLSSWRTFENYTGPFGLQTLTDIVGNHYGVSVEASERNGWGQWHRAGEKGAGMDRTSATGTGFIGQYRPEVAKVFESLETCPDELLVFMHHVPYTHTMHSGKTLIQSIYDLHAEGADRVAEYVRAWAALAGRVDEQRFRAVLAQLQYQEGQAQLWRDAVSQWFQRTSGIEDALGRVGHYPGRYEAEAMKLDGYTPQAVTPWEAGSGQAVVCGKPVCSAVQRFDGAPGWYTLRVRYFDTMEGASRFKLFLNRQLLDEWAADAHLPPTRKLDGTSSSRRDISGIALRPGDELRIEGTPDGRESAPLDYLEIVR